MASYLFVSELLNGPVSNLLALAMVDMGSERILISLASSLRCDRICESWKSLFLVVYREIVLGDLIADVTTYLASFALASFARLCLND